MEKEAKTKSQVQRRRNLKDRGVRLRILGSLCRWYAEIMETASDPGLYQVSFDTIREWDDMDLKTLSSRRSGRYGS